MENGTEESDVTMQGERFTRRQCMLIFVDLPLAIGRTSTFLSHRGLIP